VIALVPLQRLFDQESELFRIDGLALLERSMRTSTYPFQNRSKLLSNDVLTDFLVVRFESRKILLVKKVTERAMPDIVQQPCEAKEFFDIERRGEFVLVNSGQGGIQPFREGPGDMQGPEGVLESGMFCRGKHPASALELKDPPEPLNPRCVDDIPLRSLSLDAVRHDDVVVEGICN